MIQETNCINFFHNLILRELYLEKIECWIAGGCLWRMQKYIQKGYLICKEELLKIIQEIKTSNIEDENISDINDVSSLNGID